MGLHRISVRRRAAASLARPVVCLSVVTLATSLAVARDAFAAGASTRRPLASAEVLAARDPDLARRLAAGEGFARSGAELSSHAWRAPDASESRLAVRLPAAANGALSVRLGSSTSHALAVHLDGARPSAATLDGGRVVYESAYRSSDAIVASTPYRLDTMLLLRAADAPRTFAMRVDIPAGVTGVEREPASGAWLFHDARHDGVVRALRPSVVDAQGVRRDAELAWDGRALDRLRRRGGSSVPMLLDVAIEAALWQQRCTDDACKANQPTARSRVAMAFDADRGSVLTFGGWGATATALGHQDVELGRHEVDAPHRRRSQRAQPAHHDRRRGRPAGDDVRRQHAGEPHRRQRLTNGASNIVGRWAQFTGASPPPLMGLGLAYDRKAGKGVMLGGLTAASVTDAGAGDAGPTIVVHHSRDTWIWDGKNGGSWTNLGLAPEVSPPPRRFFTMAYDEARSEVVLFGGEVQFESDYFGGRYGRWNDLGMEGRRLDAAHAGATRRPRAARWRWRTTRSEK